MNILITGGSGLLGQFLNIELSENNNILTLFNKNAGNCRKFNSVQIDITDFKKLSQIFHLFNPDVVVHTAAIANPILASQIDTKLVYKINVNATHNLAKLCSEFGAKLIYTSTDLVYAGYRGSMLTENAKLIPVSLYAESKLMGEIKIRETFNNYLILRMSLLFGFGLNNSYNHFHQMYLNLKNGIPVKLFTDQYRTPIELGNAAEIINLLIDKGIKTETINIGGKERLSRYQLGQMLCHSAGFEENLIKGITMDEIQNLPKVEDVSLNTTKLQSYGIKINSVSDSINRILK